MTCQGKAEQVFPTLASYLFLQSLIHSIFIPLLSVFALKPVCKGAILNLKKVVLGVLWLPSDAGGLYLSGQVF